MQSKSCAPSMGPHLEPSPCMEEMRASWKRRRTTKDPGLKSFAGVLASEQNVPLPGVCNARARTHARTRAHSRTHTHTCVCVCVCVCVCQCARARARIFCVVAAQTRRSETQTIGYCNTHVLGRATMALWGYLLSLCSSIMLR